MLTSIKGNKVEKTKKKVKLSANEARKKKKLRMAARSVVPIFVHTPLLTTEQKAW
jgi:hypothetical protein